MSHCSVILRISNLAWLLLLFNQFPADCTLHFLLMLKIKAQAVLVSNHPSKALLCLPRLFAFLEQAQLQAQAKQTGTQSRNHPVSVVGASHFT